MGLPGSSRRRFGGALAGAVIFSTIVSGCASSTESSRNRLVWNIAQQCASFTGGQLLAIDPDGNAWIGWTGPEGQEFWNQKQMEFNKCTQTAVHAPEEQRDHGARVDSKPVPLAKRD